MVSELAGEGALPLPTPASHAELRRVRLQRQIHIGSLLRRGVTRSKQDFRQISSFNLLFPQFGEDRSTVLFFQSSTSRSVKFLSKMLFHPLYTVFSRSRSESSSNKVFDYPPSVAFNRSPWSRSMESVGESMSTVLISSTSVAIVVHGVDPWRARAQSSLILRQWPHNSMYVKEDSPLALVWIQLSFLPIHLFQFDMIAAICEPTGREIALGSATIHRTEPNLAKVRVEIDVSKHVSEKIWIEIDSDRRGFWHNIVVDVRCLVFDKKVSHASGGLTRVEKDQIDVIQFQIFPPKTDIEHIIVASDYTQMDRILKEERITLIKSCSAVKGSAIEGEKEILVELEEQLLNMRFQSLCNWHLQWCFVNAKTDSAYFKLTETVEWNLYNAQLATPKLLHSVKSKQTELFLLKQNFKLYHICSAVNMVHEMAYNEVQDNQISDGNKNVSKTSIAAGDSEIVFEMKQISESVATETVKEDTYVEVGTLAAKENSEMISYNTEREVAGEVSILNLEFE